MKHKQFWLGVGSAYLVYSAIAGMAMKAAMPALNPLGVAYIGLTWPVPMTCLAIHSDCSVVPSPRYANWFFNTPPASNPIAEESEHHD